MAKMKDGLDRLTDSLINFILLFTRYPAFAGLLFDFSAFMFTASAVFNCLYDDGKGGQCSTMIDTNVECDDEVCKFKHGNSAISFDGMDWQEFLFLMTAISFAVDFTSVGLQLLVFWPLAMVRGVFRFILRTCSYLDFVSGIIKFCAAWIIIHKQQAINKSYISYERDALKMSLIPPACLQFSLILSFVAVVMLRVATDRGAPGQPTYLELIDIQRREEKQMRVMGSRASQYRPQSVITIKPMLERGSQFSSTSV